MPLKGNWLQLMQLSPVLKLKCRGMKLGIDNRRMRQQRIWAIYL
jgi:hypothetical protein